MKKSVLLICILILTVGWMLLIFGFSSQSGTESQGLSSLLAKPLTKLLMQFGRERSAEEEAAFYANVELVVRKIAHVTEFAVLGGLLTLLFHCLRLRNLWLPVLGGVMYAALDEWHQSFTPGRTSAWTDVLIDSCGVLIGVFICYFVIEHWRKKHVHHS